LVCGPPGSKGDLIPTLTLMLQDLNVPVASWSLDPLLKALYPPYGQVPPSEGGIFHHLMAGEPGVFQHMLKTPGMVLLVDGWMMTKASRRNRKASAGPVAPVHCIWAYPSPEELAEAFVVESEGRYSLEEAELVLRTMKKDVPSFKEGFRTIWYVNPHGLIHEEMLMGLYLEEAR